MDNVINLADHRPHISGPARCSRCKHEWIAVAPVGTTQLECDCCGGMHGLFVHPCAPAEGELVFECNCGSDLFYVLPRGIMCRVCGTTTGFDEL